MDPKLILDKLLRARVLVLHNGTAAHGTAGVFVDKFIRIKHNDLARLHGAVPIGERAVT
jgi:hypothetical protein